MTGPYVAGSGFPLRTATDKRLEWLIPLLLFLGILAVYLALLRQDVDVDAIGYLQRVQTGKLSLSHFLYVLVLRAAAFLTTPWLDVETALKSVSAVSGAAAVALTYPLGRICGLPRWPSLIASGLLASTPAFAERSVTIHGAAFLGLVQVAAAIHAVGFGNDVGARGPRSYAALGAAYLLCPLAALQGILFGGAIAGQLWRRRREWTRSRLLAFCLCPAIAGLAALALLAVQLPRASAYAVYVHQWLAVEDPGIWWVSRLAMPPFDAFVAQLGIVVWVGLIGLARWWRADRHASIAFAMWLAPAHLVLYVWLANSGGAHFDMAVLPLLAILSASALDLPAVLWPSWTAVWRALGAMTVMAAATFGLTHLAEYRAATYFKDYVSAVRIAMAPGSYIIDTNMPAHLKYYTDLEVEDLRAPLRIAETAFDMQAVVTRIDWHLKKGTPVYVSPGTLEMMADLPALVDLEWVLRTRYGLEPLLTNVGPAQRLLTAVGS